MDCVREYLVPDYYPEFSCKMGACRTACCEGWPISFSLSDYFRLLGVECSAELRRKLDCSMHLSDHPTPEAYAQISALLEGDRIAQPMKYISNGLLAVILALLGNYLFARLLSRPSKPSERELLEGTSHMYRFTDPKVRFLYETRRYDPPSSSGRSGRSGGGGGRSGGGGGHRF